MALDDLDRKLAQAAVQANLIAAARLPELTQRAESDSRTLARLLLDEAGANRERLLALLRSLHAGFPAHEEDALDRHEDRPHRTARHPRERARRREGARGRLRAGSTSRARAARAARRGPRRARGARRRDRGAALPAVRERGDRLPRLLRAEPAEPPRGGRDARVPSLRGERDRPRAGPRSQAGRSSRHLEPERARSTAPRAT